MLSLPSWQTKGEITDFVSFYTLPSTVMHHPVHSHVNAAYAFYSFANSVPWTKLMQDALIIAKKVGFRGNVTQLTNSGNSHVCTLFCGNSLVIIINRFRFYSIDSSKIKLNIVDLLFHWIPIIWYSIYVFNLYSSHILYFFNVNKTLFLY